MATDYGRYIVHHVGYRSGVAPVDSTGINIILDKSHESFVMGGGVINQNNPGWVGSFINDNSSSTVENVIKQYSKYTTHYRNPTYPDLENGFNEVFKLTQGNALKLGWQSINSNKSWLDLKKNVIGLIYPIGSAKWDASDNGYEIINTTASEYLSRYRQENGGNYNRIINLHGDYTGSAPGIIASEQAGWAHYVLNIFGTVKINTVKNFLLKLGSDDMQGQINIFGYLYVGNGEIFSRTHRGHGEINIMPGGTLHIPETKVEPIGRFASAYLIQWGDGKFIKANLIDSI